VGKVVDAAAELIRARDNLRLLKGAGKATDADVQRVKDAEKAYTSAKSK